MGNHQLDIPLIQLFNQLYGRFNSLSLNYPGGLQEHDVVRFQTDRLPEGTDPFFIDPGRIFEIQSIGNHRSGNSSIEHVVINSRARDNLARRTGIAATVIPNALDFENPPRIDKERIGAFRHSIGLEPDDIMFLQPTRIVERKGIEASIQLVKELNQRNIKLVVSHAAGDEGFEYALKLEALARESGVQIRFIHDMVADPYAPRQVSNDRFSLWEVYQAADFVTFPSLYEGFGNALLEAIYFKKPLLVNRYEIFKDDIESKGFDVVKMDGRLTGATVAEVKHTINDRDHRAKMVTDNYRIAREHYSYSLLHNKFACLISNLFPQDCSSPQECQQAAAGK